MYLFEIHLRPPSKTNSKDLDVSSPAEVNRKQRPNGSPGKSESGTRSPGGSGGSEAAPAGAAQPEPSSASPCGESGAPAPRKGETGPAALGFGCVCPKDFSLALKRADHVVHSSEIWWFWLTPSRPFPSPARAAELGNLAVPPRGRFSRSPPPGKPCPAGRDGASPPSTCRETVASAHRPRTGPGAAPAAAPRDARAAKGRRAERQGRPGPSLQPHSPRAPGAASGHGTPAGHPSSGSETCVAPPGKEGGTAPTPPETRGGPAGDPAPWWQPGQAGRAGGSAEGSAAEPRPRGGGRRRLAGAQPERARWGCSAPSGRSPPPGAPGAAPAGSRRGQAALPRGGTSRHPDIPPGTPDGSPQSVSLSLCQQHPSSLGSSKSPCSSHSLYREPRGVEAHSILCPSPLPLCSSPVSPSGLKGTVWPGQRLGTGHSGVTPKVSGRAGSALGSDPGERSPAGVEPPLCPSSSCAGSSAGPPPGSVLSLPQCNQRQTTVENQEPRWARVLALETNDNQTPQFCSRPDFSKGVSQPPDPYCSQAECPSRLAAQERRRQQRLSTRFPGPRRARRAKAARGGEECGGELAGPSIRVSLVSRGSGLPVHTGCLRAVGLKVRPAERSLCAFRESLTPAATAQRDGETATGSEETTAKHILGRRFGVRPGPPTSCQGVIKAQSVCVRKKRTPECERRRGAGGGGAAPLSRGTGPFGQRSSSPPPPGPSPDGRERTSGRREATPGRSAEASCERTRWPRRQVGRGSGPGPRHRPFPAFKPTGGRHLGAAAGSAPAPHLRPPPRDCPAARRGRGAADTGAGGGGGRGPAPGERPLSSSAGAPGAEGRFLQPGGSERRSSPGSGGVPGEVAHPPARARARPATAAPVKTTTTTTNRRDTHRERRLQSPAPAPRKHFPPRARVRRAPDPPPGREEGARPPAARSLPGDCYSSLNLNQLTPDRGSRESRVPPRPGTPSPPPGMR
ncbi:collagen alpha-1(I) chain-like [Phaenicophaeus curvirostris]|uniref:collagen alpha-1(I) chain-like n=1 Tax=Phaenicophaeus curvirostris TaxID=33595 RepID=UPI0037F0D412